MKLNFILFLIFLTSCKQNETPGKLDTNEPLTVYNEESYYELLEKNKDLKVKVIDTSCINERKRAESDIKKGKLYFFRSKVWFEWKEMAELLSEYNIEYKDYEHICFGPPPGFEHDCYEKLMWTEIDKRIGENTIDSLWKIAERNFVLKYPDSLYIKDGIDIRKKYLTE
jgi:hypothetical protein